MFNKSGSRAGLLIRSSSRIGATCLGVLVFVACQEETTTPNSGVQGASAVAEGLPKSGASVETNGMRMKACSHRDEPDCPPPEPGEDEPKPPKKKPPKRTVERGLCVAPKNPFRNATGSEAREPTTDLSVHATLALFVVGPNHRDSPVQAGSSDHTNAEGVRNIAQRINRAWPYGASHLVVAISETGGCDDCWLGGGTAEVLRAELTRLYSLDPHAPNSFEMRWAAPRLPTDYTSMPAIIYGSAWRSDDGIGSIGADLPSLTNNRYAYLRLWTQGAAYDFYVVHLSSDTASNRLAQVNALVYIISSRRNEAKSTILAGDFNVNLGDIATGAFSQDEDRQWMQRLASDANWVGGEVPCWYYLDGVTPTETSFFGTEGNPAFKQHEMGVAEFSASTSKNPEFAPLRPYAYLFDQDSAGAPITTAEPIHAQGIAHGIIGVVFQ